MHLSLHKSQIHYLTYFIHITCNLLFVQILKLRKNDSQFDQNFKEKQLVTFESSQQWIQMAYLSKPMGGISPTFTGTILRLFQSYSKRINPHAIFWFTKRRSL